MVHLLQLGGLHQDRSVGEESQGENAERHGDLDEGEAALPGMAARGGRVPSPRPAAEGGVALRATPSDGGRVLALLGGSHASVS